MELETLVIRLTGDSLHYQKMLEEAIKQTDSFSQRMAKSFNDVNNAMKTMAATIAAPITLMGTLGVKAFSDFDAAMTNSTAIMAQMTGEQRKQMEDLALSLSTTGKQTPTQMAEAYFYLASAGLSVEQSLAALPAVQKFATAGNFDLAMATTLAADAQASLGLKVADATQNMQNMVRITDVLVRANTLANANVQQFSKALTTQAGAAMKSFGVRLEEGVAVLAALADQGIKSEKAGQSFSRFLRVMTAAAVTHAAAHKRLGIAVFDANGKLRNQADVLENLETVLRPMNDQLRSAELLNLGFEARLQQSILPLLGTSKAVREYERELNEAGGTTEEVSKKTLKSFENQVVMVKNQVITLAITLGAVLAPALLIINDGVSQSVAFLKSLDPVTQRTIVVIAAVTAGLITMFATITMGLKLIAIMTGGFPIIMGLVVVGIVAAAIATAEFVNKMGGIKEALDYVKERGLAAWAWLKNVRAMFVDFFMVLWFVARGTFDNLLELAIKTWDDITGGARVDWAQVEYYIIKTIAGAEWVLLNFQQTAELVWAGIKYYTIAALNLMLENVSYYLTGPIMVALWTGHTLGWKNVFDIVLQYWFDTWKILFKVATLNTAIMWEILTGKKSKGEVNTETLGVIKFKPGGIEFEELKKLEVQLKKEYEALGNKAATSFNQFFKDKIKQLIDTQESVAPIPEKDKEKTKKQYEQFGLDIGQAATQSLGKEMDRFQNVLRSSAEAITRIQEYRDVMMGVFKDDDKKGEHYRSRGKSPQLEVQYANSIGAASTKQDSTDVLKEIREILKAGNKRPEVKIEPANL